MSTPEDLPNNVNLEFVERLFADYVRDPGAVSPQWRDYFRRLGDPGARNGPLHLGPSFLPTSIFNPTAPRADGKYRIDARQDRVDQIVRAYRVRGHTIARLDPLDRPRPPQPELEIEQYGLTEADLDQPFSSRTIQGAPVRTLREILSLLRDTYCRSIGVQFMHIDDLDVRHWLQERMEGTRNRITLSRKQQLRILVRLTDAVIFEEFIQKKYIGAKSFSLEGAESLIPLLELAIEAAGEQGIQEIIVGMAHRGRLNVLANIMGKSPRRIFREFEDLDPEQHAGHGDVKYHLGYHTDWRTVGGRLVHLALCFNPSHLEYVNPVALGRVRAKQDRLADQQRDQSMAILIHGDAAFAGEGIVQETLNMSQLPGYTTGGTLHVVVNNQLGFTTSPEEGRSGLYCSAIGKMLQIPLFHVNGEDPEAVAQAVSVAMDFRREFKRDVIIDMYCYRRRGHNESDEGAFTQPLMYRAIRRRQSVRDAYLEHLARLGGVAQSEADAIAARRREHLEDELAVVREQPAKISARPSVLGKVWEPYRGGPEPDTPECDTGLPAAELARLLQRLCDLPPDFKPHPKIERLLENRRQMATGEKPLDWATAESLAFATLAVSGARIRLSGQDSGRGTFSQRHAILHDFETGQTYTPLQHLAENQAPVDILNSPLSEAGVLGFDYGYSVAYPDALVMWEAQFGDFCNAAQVIIDQFIVSAEDKWHLLSGVVLLLPHGLEGQGPEHSSARLERFLMLSAEDNIQVAVPSTPAQYFHLLRRQVVRPWRKPLVIMTPKSLLRYPACVSPLDELGRLRFQRFLPDELARSEPPEHVLLCCGKIYYELYEERAAAGRLDVAILRLEQLYPLTDEIVAKALAPYAEGTPVVWVQEEPENMGAWRYLRNRFGERLLGRYPLSVVSRPESASPATGSAASHKLEQRALLAEALHRRTR